MQPQIDVKQSIRIFAAFLIVGLYACTNPDNGKIPGENQSANSHLVQTSLSELPLRFEPNQGQFDKEIQYVARGPGYALVLKDGWSSIRQSNTRSTGYISFRLAGGQAGVQPAGEDPQQGATHYFIGKSEDDWTRNVPSYSSVRYADIYPGIDAVYYGNPNQLEIDFEIAPESDPENIFVEFVEGTKLQILPDGSLKASRNAAEISLSAPKAFQTSSKSALQVESQYRLISDRVFGFRLGSYDTSRPLLIDPVVFTYATYLGGSELDAVTAVGEDATGNIYLAGYTNSADMFTPTGEPFAGGDVVDGARPGSFDGLEHLSQQRGDAFVMKLNSDASQVLWSTYLGGSEYGGGDAVNDLAVDSEGAVIVTGSTRSTDFPTEAAFIDSRPSRTSAFVTKISPDGSWLDYSTYLGGGGVRWSTNNATNFGLAVEVDAGGNAYVAGMTGAQDFPVTVGSLIQCGTGEQYCWHTDCGETASQGDCGGTDGFVTKFDPDGAVVYSTILASIDGGWEGGIPRGEPSSMQEYISGIGVDDAGRAYVVGSTQGGCMHREYREGVLTDVSTPFPTTPGAYQEVIPGCDSGSDPVAFVSVINPNGSGLDYSTLFGVLDGEVEGLDIDLGADGKVYITGITSASNIPVVNPFQSQFGGGNCPSSNGGLCHDAFVARFDASLSSLEFSSYLGGSGPAGRSVSMWPDGEDVGRSIAVATNGDMLVGGTTWSADFRTEDAFQTTLGGYNDGFLTRIAADGSLVYSSYLGSTYGDEVFDVYVGEGDRLLVGGMTGGMGEGFQSDAPIQDRFGGGTDGFMVGVGSPAIAMIPEGVGYDEGNADQGVGTPQNAFGDLVISGSNFEDVEEVIFKLDGEPDPMLQAYNVRVGSSTVFYDLSVFHGAELGERDVFLRMENGSEINITDSIGKGFLITRLSIRFNQGVDDKAFPTKDLRTTQIANKLGVVRLRFDGDPERDDETYTGELSVEGFESISTPVRPYTQKEHFTEQEIFDGKAFMVFPFPFAIPDGKQTFVCELRSAQWHLKCPTLSREFLMSQKLRILIVGVKAELGNGRILKPTSSPEEVKLIIEPFLQRVYPVSMDRLEFVLAPFLLPLPDEIVGGIYLITNELREFDRSRFENLVGRSGLDRWNKTLQESGEEPVDLAMILYPEGFLGSGVRGYASGNFCAVFMDGSSENLQHSAAHEIGHVLGRCASERNLTYDLGDEYEGGFFNCEVNPPALSVTGIRMGFNPLTLEEETEEGGCIFSPFELGVGGNNIGTYTGVTAYDFVDHETMFHWNGDGSESLSRDVYNFMAGAQEGAEYWTTAWVYDALHNVFVPEVMGPGKRSNQSTAGDPHLLISGGIDEAGKASFASVDHVAKGFVTSSSSGPYKLQLLDERGVVLESQSFALNHAKLTNPPIYSASAGFSKRLPHDPRAAAVKLSYGSTELVTKHLTSNGPELTIKSPLPGQPFSKNIDLKWEATDVDGDPMSYDVVFYPKAAESGIPIAVGKTDTYARLDLSKFPNVDRPAIKVFATDGYNTTEAKVELFGSSTPNVESVSPAQLIQGQSAGSVVLTGSSFTSGASVSVSGNGVSVVSATVENSSKIAVVVNVASDAASGPRSVRVTNPDGSFDEAAGVLSIIGGSTNDIRLTWLPPDPAIANGPPRNLTITAAAQSNRPVGYSLSRAPGSNDSQRLASIVETEPNNTEADAQRVYGPSPAEISGNLELADVGDRVVRFAGSSGDVDDDVEDLFVFETDATGDLSLEVKGCQVSCRLYLFNQGLSVSAFGNPGGEAGTYVLTKTDLGSGTYIAGVSIWEGNDTSENTTSYTLKIAGNLVDPPAGGDTHTGYRVYRSAAADAHNTGQKIADLDPEVTEFSDAGVSGSSFYQVTAVYPGGESGPSNEVLSGGSGVPGNLAPIVLESPGDVTLLMGLDPYRLNMLRVFEDPDGDELAYAIASDNTAVATAVVESPFIQISALSKGNTTITITATDGRGGSAIVIVGVTIPTGVAVENSESQLTFALHGNYPNPFRTSTTIWYEVAEATPVSVEVFNLLGKRVAKLTDGNRSAGRYRVRWNGSTAAGGMAPAGIYIYRLKAGNYEESRTLVLVR